jgi:DNA-damage-inducible protein J
VGYNVDLKEKIMSQNAVVRARIDETIKEEAATVLATMGLTVSDVFRMMMTRIAREKALPFEPLVPNKETLNAMREARQGKNLKSFNTVDDLMADLNSDD